MGKSKLLQELKYFLSVESLDWRLLPKIGPQEQGSKKKDTKSSKRKEKRQQELAPALWNTFEFRLYYLAFILVVPWMIKTAMDASNETNPNYYRFERLLSQGWLFGRKVDNSDSQYRFFRDNLGMLAGLMGMHVILKKTIRKTFNVSVLRFDFIFGLIFLVAAHGSNSIRVLLHMLIMFIIPRLFRPSRKLATLLTWTYGIGSLFINENYRTYPIGSVIPALSFLDTSFKGIIARWDVFYNFSLLRMLSYDMDYLERWYNLKNSPKGAQVPDSINSPDYDYSEEMSRLKAPLRIEDYKFLNYVAYVTYTPLFIAGPIITFNDYICQTRFTLPSINKKQIVGYALKLAIALLTMEFILHFMYVVAVSKTKAWDGDTPFQISMIGLMNLNIIWLKLMIPWRWFRLWAMLDGVDTPENMIRCVDNNYSALAFWRAWHRSYNKWIVRYIYIPLGGSKNRILTSLAVFSFVAIWHDIQLKLLLWGWLIVLFLLPEISATRYFAKYNNMPWFRYLCGVGAVINIWMMMIANLFGFCLGLDGTKLLLHDMFCSLSGVSFVIAASSCIFIAVQLMFEQRESEKRAGIYVKC